MSMILSQSGDFLAAGEAAGPLGRGMALLVALVLLLGAFLLMVALLSVMRRNRRQAEEGREFSKRMARVEDERDAWYEAGRRAE